MTVVTFPNAVDVLLKYLRPVEPTVEFGTSRDGGSPTPLVVLRRVGGVSARVTDLARVDVLVWHSSEFKAMALAQTLRGRLLFDLPGRVVDGHPVYAVTEFAGPADYPDPAGSAQPIVLFTVEVAVRGAST